MNELAPVVLCRDLPDHGLEAGDVGTVVHVHDQGAFEVEFVAGTGDTLAVLTLSSDDVRRVEGREILHVRRLPST